MRVSIFIIWGFIGIVGDCLPFSKLWERELKSEMKFWWGLVKVEAQTLPVADITTSHTSLQVNLIPNISAPPKLDLQIQALQLIMASENESASDSGSRGAKRVRTDSNPAPPVKKEEDGKHPRLFFERHRAN